MRTLRVFLRVAWRLLWNVLYWLLEIALLPFTFVTFFLRASSGVYFDPEWLWLGRYFLDRLYLLWQEEERAEAVTAGEVEDKDILMRIPER